MYLNGSHKHSTSVLLKILESELPPVPNTEIGEIGEGFLFLLILHELMWDLQFISLSNSFYPFFSILPAQKNKQPRTKHNYATSRSVPNPARQLDRHLLGWVLCSQWDFFSLCRNNLEKREEEIFSAAGSRNQIFSVFSGMRVWLSSPLSASQSTWKEVGWKTQLLI